MDKYNEFGFDTVTATLVVIKHSPSIENYLPNFNWHLAVWNEEYIFQLLLQSGVDM